MYTQEKGDLTIIGATWNTDCITQHNLCTVPPYSGIEVISKNKIYVMINGLLERKVRSGFELRVLGIENIFPEHDQVMAVMVAVENKIQNLPISCIVNNDGLKIEHDEIETDWYRVEAFLETIDYPVFHYQD